MIGKDQSPSIGKRTQFSTNNQPVSNGRKPSLKTQLSKVSLLDGQMIIDANRVTIKGDKAIISVPNEESLALRLFDIAMGKNPSTAISAIKLYLETFDGKPTSTVVTESSEGNKKAIGEIDMDQLEEQIIQNLTTKQ